ncbi:FAD-dependent oxidoreductase [Alkalihalobacterium chitinilyticum]|uniref:FAD-dependent monooxygenase n=1 Tax=Alkalihalobacterium chitinilyticum TaxID=2980103 RepID=A0ABT5VBT6_9BACI|nr:NAD(P)/FAD-dependent oxidoreductase [Alkalihalobacterium chitinilyticum]MDE5412740.1 FAD-dependent monooxygenase [Alkalihalobacterium chitinilyticum]
MNVFISGGGIAGLTLALKLLQNNINVTVVEKNAKPSPKYKGELLQPKSIEILSHLGLGDQLLKYGEKIEQMIVKEIEPTHQVKYAKWDYRILDHSFNYAMMIPHEKLKEILLDACHQLNDHFYFGDTKFITLEPEGTGLKQVAVIEQAGEEKRIPSDFFVGAEGRMSPVRQTLGIGLKRKKYNHHFLTVSFPKPSQLKEATIITKGDQLLGVFPLPNDLVRTVLLIKSGEYKQLLRSGLDTLHQRYIDLMPAMDGFVQSVDSFKKIQLMIPVNHHAETYVFENTAIIGDAAHSVHPIAGEGMNLAIQDSDVLGELLTWMDRTNQLDPTLLRWFERVRRPRVEYISNLSHLSALVYSYDFALWRKFRMQVLQRIEKNSYLHFKQILNISGLGAWKENMFDRLMQAGFPLAQHLGPSFNQKEHFYTKEDDYPWY